MRNDISRVQRLKERMWVRTRFREDLPKKPWMKDKGYKHVIEELKQRVTAKAAKVKRYKERMKQYRQNKLCQMNQKRVYQELNEEDR